MASAYQVFGESVSPVNEKLYIHNAEVEPVKFGSIVAVCSTAGVPSGSEYRRASKLSVEAIEPKTAYPQMIEHLKGTLNTKATSSGFVPVLSVTVDGFANHHGSIQKGSIHPRVPSSNSMVAPHIPAGPRIGQPPQSAVLYGKFTVPVILPCVGVMATWTIESAQALVVASKTIAIISP